MNLVLSFIRLTRLLNVMILVLVEVILYYAYILFYANQLEVNPALSSFQFWIFVTITALVTIGGNMINDIMDVDIDEINRPDTRVVDVAISSKAAMSLYQVINGIALLMTTYWFYSTQNKVISVILLLSALGMYYYSSWMKRKFLIGNLFVSILCALPPLLLLFLEFDTIKSISDIEPTIGLWIISTIGIYSYFAFSSTLYREVVKDIQDIPGDKAMGSTTLPIIAGGFIAKRVALVIGFMISFSLLTWLIFSWSMDSTLNTVAIILGLLLPLGISISRLYRAKSVMDFKSVSNAIKLLMFNGIIYLLIVRTLITAV